MPLGSSSSRAAAVFAPTAGVLGWYFPERWCLFWVVGAIMVDSPHPVSPFPPNEAATQARQPSIHRAHRDVPAMCVVCDVRCHPIILAEFSAQFSGGAAGAVRLWLT